eukprot:4964693-Pyramimonas_sp.AAC.1
MAQIKLVFTQWQGPRIIRARSHLGMGPRHATYGLPAGDKYADIVIEAHAVEEYDEHVAIHRCVFFSSYIDDAAIGVEGDAQEEVIRNATDAGKGFRATAAKLKATINGKFAI